MGKLNLTIFEKFKLVNLAKKHSKGNSERSDLKQWEYLLSKSNFTSNGFYYSERVKHTFLDFLKLHHPYIKDTDKYFMKKDALDYLLQKDAKMRRIVEKYQMSSD
ncbi:hypothetical protein BSK66_26615 [Paenibacillus odorifer]|uniref:hypothetical protein n=1 Tax=Paenibacillus TaxID=44249 RepID=UPI0003E26573|nr:MULTISPECIES: hypothetical protein [Paenibacillus]ETT49321.1 hypothetical protein C171_23650 [Paenibacillus sp. FSL H8-237]OME49533.1 hypothetical protein BSK66_26615 [Paenibacillus odorifer]